MRNFTFYDSGGNRTRTTKRWLGLLTICLLLFAGQVGFAILNLDTKEILTDFLKSKSTVQSQKVEDSTTAFSLTLEANNDDNTPYNCSQTTEGSSIIENGFFFGGDTNQILAVDIPIYEGTTFEIQTIKINTAGAATYFDIIIHEDASGLPGTIINTFNNVSITSSVITGNEFDFDFYQHTLDISAEELLLSSPIGNTRYWMQVVSDAVAWESTSNYQIGLPAAISNDNSSGWVIDDEGLVYELIGECTGEMPIIYCMASSTNTSDVISSFITTGGILNISNNSGTIISPGGYGDFTNFSVAHFETGTISFTTVFSASMGFNIWVDWNGNGIFEESEKVYASGATGSSFTGSFTIPVDTELGDYRMRIRAQWLDSPLPCGNISYGEAEDYTLTVIDPPACLPPYSLTATPTSLTEVTLGWDSDGDNFNVEWGAAGFTLGEGTQITGITNNSTSITVTIDTPYEFYVLQDCGADDGESLWAGPFSFQTGYCIPFYTYGCSNGAKIANFETSDAILNVANNTGTATCGTNGYNNFSSLSAAAAEDMTISFIVGVGSYSAGVKLWIDWNANGVFDTDELMSESTTTIASGSSYTGSFTVPAGTPLGDYRLRVRAVESTTTFDACSTYNYGETEDYTFTVIDPPACMPPSELGLAGATFTSADLTWTSAGNAFEVEYGLQGFTLGSGSSVIGINTNETTLTGLTADTHYQYYVRQDCGVDGFSLWAGPYTFFTGYCQVTSTWTGSRITDFSTSDGYTNIDNPNNGTDNAYSNFSNFSVTQSEGGSFNYAVNVPSYTNVEIWIDYNNNMIFDTDELVAQNEYITTAGTLTGTISIPAVIEEGDYRIRVRSRDYWNTIANPCGNVTYGEAEDYTLTIVPIPACLPPSGLTATPTSLTDVTLGWTSIGNNFDIEWGPTGFTLGSGTPINEITTNSTSISVTIDTPYQFYVRQDCGTDGESLWAGPFSFQTGYCMPLYTWGCASGAKIANFETSDAILNIANNTGTTNCGIDGYDNFSNMSVAAPENMTVSFTVEIGSWSAGVKLWVDWNANGVFDADELMSESTGTIVSGGTYTGSFTVPSGTALGDYRLRVRAVENTTAFDACNLQGYGETEDYTFTVITPPTCMPANQLGVNITTSTSAELYWSSIESSNVTFEVEYGLQGFTLGTGTSIENIIETSTNVTDFSPDTWYSFYVLTDCGTDGESLWAGPYTFFTGYCVPSSTNSSDHISSFVTTGGLPFNISNTNSGASPGGYGNFGNMSVSHYETGTVDFTVTAGGDPLGVNIWIDWNNNLEFEESEKVFQSASSGAVISGSITVPFGIPVGDYRMRVRGQYGYNNNPNPEPCGSITWGEAEDYTFTVITPPDCLPPFTPTATNISASSVLLEWLADGELFDIEYGPVGFTPGDGELITGVGNPYTLAGVTAGVDYDFYVRQDCGEDDGVSMWNGPTTFTPGVYIGDIPSMYNPNPSVEDDACAMPSFSIEVPEGHYLSELSVEYTMISTPMNMAQVAHQRSVLYSPTLEMGEPQVVAGDPTYTYPGPHPYDRNIDFALGATGTIEFVLKVWRTEGGTGCNLDYVFVQDGTWILHYDFEAFPTCPIPTDLGYTNITETSVDLIWQSEAEGVFDLEWGTIGFTPGEGEAEGTFYGIEDMIQPITGLDSADMYEFYVRSNCSTDDEEDMSDWAGPFKFKSGYCAPISQQSRFITLFSTSEAEENITYTGSTLPAGSVFGYRDKTEFVIVQQAGESFDFQSNYVGGQSGARIWVDWNQNFAFEDEEEVYYHGGAALKSGTITIPEDILPGDYVLRIYYQSGATSVPTACGNVSEGEAIDFTLRIPCEEVAIPTGNTTQTFTTGQTLADLVVSGSNLVWYADADLTIVLEQTHELVHETTYYVVATYGQCVSEALAITVEEVVSTDRFDSASFKAYPNPVRDYFNISYSNDINDVMVINMLGQTVITKTVQATDTHIDMSGLPTGTYFVKVNLEGIIKTIKVTKQ